MRPADQQNPQRHFLFVNGSVFQVRQLDRAAAKAHNLGQPCSLDWPIFEPGIGGTAASLIVREMDFLSSPFFAGCSIWCRGSSSRKRFSSLNGSRVILVLGKGFGTFLTAVFLKTSLLTS